MLRKLPETNDNGVLKAAHISDCGNYRYLLTRRWNTHLRWVRPTCTFVMLNPSTADNKLDDPTIRRCIKFAEREDCDKLMVVNCFALRATNPAELRFHPDPMGPLNRETVFSAILNGLRTGGPVIAAWGAWGAKEDPPPGHWIKAGWDERSNGKLDLKCLGLTKDGCPKHPLYVKGDTPLVDF